MDESSRKLGDKKGAIPVLRYIQVLFTSVMNFYVLFIGFLVSLCRAKILYVSSFEELGVYFPSDSEPCIPTGYSVLYLHALMAPEEYQKFLASYPRFKHYQVVERFLHGIYVIPTERKSIRFPKQPIASFDEDDKWTDDDDDSDNDDDKQDAATASCISRKPELNTPKKQSVFDASMIRPYSLDDYFDLGRFQREHSYQVEEILLTLCIHASLMWNFAYCQNYKLIQYWFDALDYKWFKGIDKFFNQFPNIPPSMLMSQSLAHLMDSIFRDESIQKISRETDDWEEFRDKMKNLNAVFVTDASRYWIKLIKFEKDRTFLTSYLGETFWKVFEEFKRTSHVRLAISSAHFILKYCPNFERSIFKRTSVC